jgi:hypothetical protein
VRAVDIAFAGDDKEFTGHEGREGRVGVSGVGPRVGEQQAGTVGDAGACAL